MTESVSASESQMMNRAFNFEVQHRAEPLCGSKRMRAFNFEIPSEPSLPVLAVASACYRKQFCTAPEIYSSFAPLERRESFRGRSFYKHLAPNGANSNKTLLHFNVESTYDKHQMTNDKSSVRLSHPEKAFPLLMNH